MQTFYCEELLYVFIAVSVIVFHISFKLMFKKEPPEETIEEKEPKIVNDPTKALAKQVKFVMRLKRRMKDFKARKSLQKPMECWTQNWISKI